MHPPPLRSGLCRITCRLQQPPSCDARSSIFIVTCCVPPASSAATWTTKNATMLFSLRARPDPNSRPRGTSPTASRFSARLSPLAPPSSNCIQRYESTSFVLRANETAWSPLAWPTRSGDFVNSTETHRKMSQHKSILRTIHSLTETPTSSKRLVHLPYLLYTQPQIRMHIPRHTDSRQSWDET